MTYATRSTLELHYGVDEIAQRESMLGPGAIDNALVDADAFIDGYLVGRYTLPLSTVPANLPAVAAQLVRYALLGDAATERSRNDYKDATAWLRDVQAGRVLLQAATPLPGNAPDAIVMSSSAGSVFKRNSRP
jgi:phage gp36-like protein